MDQPTIVTRGEWLNARKRLLAKEKELTRARDALSAARRALPMVRVDKPYTLTVRKGRQHCSTSSTGMPAMWARIMRGPLRRSGRGGGPKPSPTRVVPRGDQVVSGRGSCRC